uniref:Uncharacterized protein n=1 Tax=Ovis aries TaxID=9940 RepID=A0AC11CU71_SHEEP
MGSVSVSGRFTGGRHGNPLQSSCLGNPMDSGAWQATSQGLQRVRRLRRLSMHTPDFTKCCKDSGVLMVVKCRKENSALKDCLTSYYKDPAFYEECKMEYLKEREEFRRTGIPTKKRLQKLPTSM